MQTIIQWIGGVLVALITMAGYTITPIQSPTLGSFTPAGGLTYYLKSSIGTTNSSIVLTSFKNRSDIPLTMAYLNTSIAYGTLDPQTTNSEFISFTGVTQNADGTATLTGVTRGLSDIYDFTASTTMRQSHAGQSIFILSDSPAMFNEYAVKRNTENITGGWGFAIDPYSYGTATSTSQYATRAYANSLSIQGAATSTITASGIGLLATGAQAAAGTYTLTSPYFLSTLISTSTWFSAYNNQSIITKTNDSLGNTIDPNFLPRASAINWYGTGTTTFQSPIQLLNQTYIAASGTKPIYFNNVAYTFPSSVTASSTVPMTDASGNITWNYPQWEKLAEYTTVNATTGTTTVTVPNRKEYKLVISIAGMGANAIPALRFNGVVTASYSSKISEDMAGGAAVSNSSQMNLSASALNSGLGQYFNVQISNESFTGGNVRPSIIQGLYNKGLTGSTAGEILFGTGAFDSATAITSISLTHGNASTTWAQGTQLTVYGSRD